MRFRVIREGQSFAVYTENLTGFGSRPARNFVRLFDDYEEAKVWGISMGWRFTP